MKKKKKKHDMSLNAVLHHIGSGKCGCPSPLIKYNQKYVA